jgi:Golgi phosphoprotein 3 GPP34
MRALEACWIHQEFRARSFNQYPRGSPEDPVAGLNGTGRLADDLYLLGRSDISGKPFLQPRATGIGLAGALLAELVLSDHIQVGPDGIAVVCFVPPADDLARHVLGLVTGEDEDHLVREWLLYIGRTAADDVAQRLARSGYLARRGGRWRVARWVPVDADSAFAPLLRARSALDASRPLTVHSAVLAGLVTACGLGFRLAQYAPPRVGRSVEQAVTQLGPGPRELIAQTQAAVDSALLAHRV